MNHTAFQLDRVAYAYPQGEPVLENLSLTVSEGERLSILGANGCGKSTLLKILAGLIFPQSGTLTAFGKEISQKSFSGAVSGEYHRSVGFIFKE